MGIESGSEQVSAWQKGVGGDEDEAECEGEVVEVEVGKEGWEGI